MNARHENADVLAHVGVDDFLLAFLLTVRPGKAGTTTEIDSNQ